MFSLARSHLRPACRALAVAAALSAGACSGDVSPLRTLGVGGGAPKGPDAPDFVTQSRTGGGTFMPVGVSAPPRAVRAKSGDSQKSLEADLEGARNRNLTRGRAAESAGKSVAPAPAPSPAPSPAQTPPPAPKP